MDELKINVEAGHGGPGCSSFLISNRELHGKPDGGDGARGGHVYLVAVDEKIHGHSISSLDHLAAGVFKAGHGGKGGKSLCTGKSGQDLEIIVPAGTIVDVLMRKEADRNMEEENEKEYNNFMEFAQFSGLHPESFDKLLARGGPAAVKKSMKEKKHEFDLVKRELMIRHGLLKSETFELRRGQRVLIARGGNGGRGNYHLGLNNDSKEGGGVGEYVECLLRLK